MYFHPERVALVGALLYLFIWLAAPLRVVFSISLGAVAYVVTCYLAFFLGCILCRAAFEWRQKPSDLIYWRYPGRLFWTCCFLGALGMSLRVYDKFIIRGISLASSAIEARVTLTELQAGPLAALGGALFAFCYVPLIIYWMAARGERSPPFVHKVAAVALALLPTLDALLLLSRSQMLVALGMMYFASSCVLYNGRALPPKMRRLIVVGAAAFFVISATAFASRLEQMGLQLGESIVGSAYGYVVTPTDWAIGYLQSDGMLGSSLANLIPLLQYYTHGLFEFGLLWDRRDPQDFSLGSQLFGPYLKAFNILGIEIAPANPSDYYVRVGVFTSFFGPLWTDFGWLGIPFMTLFGGACKFVADRARAGRLAAFPLHSYLCVVVFFMPVVNFLVSSQGMYVITALVSFWFLARRQQSLNLRTTRLARQLS